MRIYKKVYSICAGGHYGQEYLEYWREASLFESLCLRISDDGYIMLQHEFGEFFVSRNT